MNLTNKIGFMQGRLSPLVDGRIQAFPWSCWQEEFVSAECNGFHLMEWTLDQERLQDNPLLTPEGQTQIRLLCERHRLSIPSMTGDCFMQAPLWKASGSEREKLKRDFLAICDGCVAVGIAIIVLPLVDNGHLDTPEQRDVLGTFLKSQTAFLSDRGLKIAFESDLGPEDLSRFITQFDADVFGINYDIGNSAALGFDPKDELAAYGRRVLNVHVKDRVRAGTTVPLGTGNADFDRVFAALARVQYGGNLILQTARTTAKNHAEVLVRYRDMTARWLQFYGP